MDQWNSRRIANLREFGLLYEVRPENPYRI